VAGVAQKKEGDHEERCKITNQDVVIHRGDRREDEIGKDSSSSTNTMDVTDIDVGTETSQNDPLNESNAEKSSDTSDSGQDVSMAEAAKKRKASHVEKSNLHDRNGQKEGQKRNTSGIDKAPKSAKFHVSENIFAWKRGVLFEAKVLKCQEDHQQQYGWKYHVHYLGYKKSHDRWLTSIDMMKMTPSSCEFYCKSRGLPCEEDNRVAGVAQKKEGDHEERCKITNQDVVIHRGDRREDEIGKDSSSSTNTMDVTDIDVGTETSQNDPLNESNAEKSSDTSDSGQDVSMAEAAKKRKASHVEKSNLHDRNGQKEGQKRNTSGIDKAPKSAKFRVNEKIFAWDGGALYEAKVLKCQEDYQQQHGWKYHVHYLGYKKSHDPWLTSIDMMKTTQLNCEFYCKSRSLTWEDEVQSNDFIGDPDDHAVLTAEMTKTRKASAVEKSSEISGNANVSTATVTNQISDNIMHRHKLLAWVRENRIAAENRVREMKSEESMLSHIMPLPHPRQPKDVNAPSNEMGMGIVGELACDEEHETTFGKVASTSQFFVNFNGGKMYIEVRSNMTLFDARKEIMEHQILDADFSFQVDSSIISKKLENDHHIAAILEEDLPVALISRSALTSFASKPSPFPPIETSCMATTAVVDPVKFATELEDSFENTPSPIPLIETSYLTTTAVTAVVDPVKVKYDTRLLDHKNLTKFTGVEVRKHTSKLNEI